MNTSFDKIVENSLWKIILKALFLICVLGLFVFVYSPINAQELEEQEIDSVASVIYKSHIQNDGWQDWAKNGQRSGTEGRSLRMEGINIKAEGDQNLGIRYKTHIQNEGWHDWVDDGDMAGTEGRSLRMEAICIELTGENAELYDLYYQGHVQNIGWMGWAKNGQPSGSSGYSYRLEAIKIIMVPTGAPAPGSTENTFIKPSDVEQVLNKMNGSWIFSYDQGAIVIEVSKTSPSTGHLYWIEYVGGGDSMEFDFKINGINEDGTAVLMMDMNSLRTYGISPGFSEIPINPLMEQPNAMIYFQSIFYRE